MSVALDGDEEALNPLRLRLLTRDQLAFLPKPRSIIDNTLDHRSVAVLAGPWGTAKTFLALDWSACIATGRDWLRRPTDRGVVVYIASEGATGLHARLKAWESMRRVTIDADSLLILPLPVQITNDAVLRNLRDLVGELNPSLIVIDTLARCMVGLDENSAKDMGLVVDALYKLRDAADDCTVLVVHHTGKDVQKIRGSSALEGGVDVVYQISGMPSDLKLKRTKRKDGPITDEHRLHLVHPEDEESVVLEAVDGVRGAVEQDFAMSTILSTLEVQAMTTAAIAKEAHLPRSTVDKKLKALEAQGRVANASTKRTKLWELGTPVD